MTSTAIPLDSNPPGEDDDALTPAEKKSHAATSDTTPGGKESARWEIVAETMGLLPAQIIAGRLQSEGIPAWAWQEAVGHIHGLTVGRMGTGYVSVPDSYYEMALQILESEDPTDDSRAEE